MGIRKGSLSYWILLALEKSIDGYVRLEDFTYNTHLYAYGDRWEQALSKSQLSQAINRLREKGLVEINQSSDQIILKLSGLGRDALGLFDLEEEWDGKWRVVIFDIPESNRVVRDLFRRRLKQWGFKRWQQSVWLTKSNITDKLRQIIKNLEIEKWVAVIESDNIYIDNKTSTVV